MGGEPLERLCTLIVDCPHKTVPKPESNDVYAYAVGTTAIGADGAITLSKARPVNRATYDTWTARAVPQEGDLILCREAPVGPVALLPSEPPICLGQRTMLLRPDRARLDPRWLAYKMRAPTTLATLLARSGGSTVDHLNVADVRAFRIAAPPLAEQRAIAAVLGALDDKLESNRRLAVSMDRLAGRTFRARFGSLIEGDTPLTELVDVVPGRSYKSSELEDGSDVALLSLKSIAAGGGYQPGGLKPYTGPFKSQQVVVPGDVVMAVTDLTQAANVVGRAARVPSQRAFKTLVVSLDVVAIRPASPAWMSYVIGLFESRAWLQQAFGYANGSTVLHLSKSAFSEFLVRRPTDREVSELAAVCDPLHAQADALRTEARTLAAIRDALLPKLVSGQIRVCRSRTMPRLRLAPRSRR